MGGMPLASIFVVIDCFDQKNKHTKQNITPFIIFFL